LIKLQSSPYEEFLFKENNRAFRNATMIAKKKKIKYQKDQPLQVVLKQQDSNFEESKTADTNTTNETEEDRSNSMIVKLTRNIKEYQDILQSSLTYLVMNFE